MFSLAERFIAFRYLKARKGDGFLSIIAGFSLIGIALGVATLIIVMSVMNGFRAELFQRILGLNGHMAVYSIEGNLKDYNTLTSRLRGVESVTQAYPLIEGQALISRNSYASGGMIRGITPEDFQQKTLLKNSLIRGDFSKFSRGEGIIIGRPMADRYGVLPGDKLLLIAPKGRPTAFGSVPRSRQFEVAAIFEIGMYEYDNTFVFMPLNLAQVFFETGDAVTGVELFFDDPDLVKSIRPIIYETAGDPVQLVDWQQANSSFFTALEVERNVMRLILTLIIAVAAFNIISMLIILVKSKRGNIAILRAMGITKGAITRIFLMIGAGVGVLGTLLGLLLGVLFVVNIQTLQDWLESLTGTNLFSAEIYFLSQIPAVIDWGEVTSILTISLVISLIFTIFPARRAAKEDPAEVLRHE